MKFELVPYRPPVLCGVRRGGRRSKITCEVSVAEHWNGTRSHFGRNEYGWWYFWETNRATSTESVNSKCGK